MKGLPRTCLLAIAIGGILITGSALAADSSDETQNDPKVRKLDAVTVTGTLLGDSSKAAVCSGQLTPDTGLSFSSATAGARPPLN
jgi:hypothetical protein